MANQTLEQLKCSKCESIYVTPVLKKDEFRFINICDNCRPKPKFASVTYGQLFIKQDS